MGLDLLQQLRTNINLATNELKLPNTKINILMKNLKHCNNLITIPANTEQKMKIKINNIKNGVGLLNAKEISNLKIPECLIQIKDNSAYISITNDSEKPLAIESHMSFDAIPQNDFLIPNFNNIEHHKTKFDFSKVRLSHCNIEEKNTISKLLKSYSDIFHFGDNPLTFTNAIKHNIKLKNDTPIYTKTYRYPYIHKEEVQRQISEMLEQGIIRHSQSAFSAPIWIVPKKLDASGKRKWRLVVDYRKLNNETINDKYPIPNINDILDKLGRCQYFSTLDLASGFHQIEVNPEDVEKTAFSVENGHYEFVRMPFGLKNAPSTFQRVMDNVLRGLQNQSCIVYLDDIIIFSTSLQEHIERLTDVFDRLRKYNFKIQLDKSEFLKKEVSYLGHIITTKGIKPNPDKIEAILNFPIPKNPKEIKSFLGLIGYYRKFILNFAKITKPLTNCLKKDSHIDINNTEYKNCFHTCQQLLTNNPILQYPDFEQPFTLTTDASNFAIGAVLSQGPDGSDLPIAYASRTLNQHEINYSTTNKELLAIVWATKYFRPYLYGRRFKIFTDHDSLTWLFNAKDPNSKMVRWRLKLEEFDYDVFYKEGKMNKIADALSRIPNVNVATVNSTTNPNEQIIDFLTELDEEILRQAANDSYSVIAEPPDTLDQIIDDDSDNITIHTNPEHPICSIQISDTPLNFSKNQISFTSVKSNPSLPIIVKLFNNAKQRFLVQISDNEPEKDTIKFVKEFIVPKTSYSCHFDSDELYTKINRIIQNNFDANILLKRSLTILEDVQNTEDQHLTIRNYHEGKSNHRGITETLQKLSSKHYFPNMQKSIQEYINNCETCKLVKYDRNPLKLKYNITPTPSKPFKIIHIDILKYEHYKFLTIIDAFSKYAQAYPVSTLTAVEIMTNLLKYFSHHSTPGLIISDNGSEFDNGLIQDFLKLHKIDIHFCSPHHPASNGLIERFHSTLLEHVKLLNNRKEFKDDSIEHKVLYGIIAYNNTLHSSTKLTPFDILNFDMQQILDIDLEQQIVNNYVESHKEKLEILYKEINTKLLEHKEKTINKLNTNREDIPNLPETVFVKSNFRSKQRNRYKKEKVLSQDKEMKIIKPAIPKSKTGRKFHKLHMENIKRPTKTKPPLTGISSPSPGPSSQSMARST